MGLARLLAKAWVLICAFAGAHAVRLALAGGDPVVAVPQVVVSTLLFAAMGLLFVGGYGASGGNWRLNRIAFSDFKLPHSLPGFNEVVFVLFVVLSFVDQVVYAPRHVSGDVVRALEGALYFAIPGDRAVVDRLSACGLDGGRVFAAALAWLLAIIFAGSAISRLKLTASAIRLERAVRPEAISPTAVAGVLGVAAVFAIQCLFVGSMVELLPCGAFAGVGGALLIGVAPLMLAYLIFAALASLLASAIDK